MTTMPPMLTHEELEEDLQSMGVSLDKYRCFVFFFEESLIETDAMCCLIVGPLDSATIQTSSTIF